MGQDNVKHHSFSDMMETLHDQLLRAVDKDDLQNGSVSRSR